MALGQEIIPNFAVSPINSMNMEKDFIIPHGIFLDANGEQHGVNIKADGSMVEIPLENAVPKWFYESLIMEDEEMEVAIVRPFMEDEFKEWLMATRKIKEKSADDYLNAFESGYDSLYEEVGIDLYDMLASIFAEMPEDSDNNLTKEDAPELVKIYFDAMLEKIDKDEDSYTKAELRALASYHAFIVDMAGTDDRKLIKEKTSPLPDEDEFRSWLETEYNMDYENIGKIVSSVKRMDVILPSMVSDPMTFLDVLRALPKRSKKENYIRLVRGQKRRIFKNANCSYKTIQNGLSNVKYYINFLNRNTK